MLKTVLVLYLDKIVTTFMFKGQGMDGLSVSNHEAAGVVPVGSFAREPEK